MTFNLIRERWIRCVGLNGQIRCVGLAEALTSSHELAEIVDESPLVMAALHRLLLAILHRNLGPRDSETWGGLWKQRRFPSEVLDAYWTKWESRFDLFDETHPFYQSATITERDGSNTIARLQFHRSAGNNATLADHTTDVLPPAMAPAEAARALVTHQMFALSGTVGYLESCEKHTERKGNDSPSARGAMCLLQGANLFETLMLNLAEYDSVAHPKDLPCWERDHSQGKGERTPDGRIDLFTWQSRRSRLFISQASDGSTQVDRVTLAPGFHVLPAQWNPFKDESLQSFIVERDAKSGETYWFQYRITPGRAVWRNSNAIIHGIRGEKRNEMQPRNLTWIGKLIWEEHLSAGFQWTVEVYGFATDQQKVELWRHEHLPVSAALLHDPRRQESLRSSLNHAEDTWNALNKATKRLAAEIISSNDSRKADPKRVMELSRSFGVGIQYWSSLSIPFHEFLESLCRSQGMTEEHAQDSAINAGFEMWKIRVRNAAYVAFTQASSGVTKNGRSLKARAIAETELRRNLKDVARKMMGGGEAEEKTK